MGNLGTIEFLFFVEHGRSVHLRTRTMADQTGIYGFFGTDHLKVKEAAREMVARLTPPDAGEFGVEIIDGVADNADAASKICREAIAAIQTLPFFGGGKVVWLRGATFLGDDQTGRAEATLQGCTHLAEVLTAGIGDDVAFVLSASAVDKRRTFYKTVNKLAKKVELFDKIDISKDGWQEQAMAEAARRGGELSLQFAPGGLEAFINRCGEDTAQMGNELEKLSLYLGNDGQVTEEIVEDMVSPTRHGVIFEIGSAIGRRDLPRALRLVRELLGQGENGVGILLAAIVPKMRNLFWARVLGNMAKVGASARYPQFQKALSQLAPEQTAHLPKSKEGKINAYPIFLSLKDATRFESRHLRQGLSACVQANLALVTTTNDPEVILTRLLVELLGPAEEPS